MMKPLNDEEQRDSLKLRVHVSIESEIGVVEHDRQRREPPQSLNIRNHRVPSRAGHIGSLSHLLGSMATYGRFRSISQ